MKTKIIRDGVEVEVTVLPPGTARGLTPRTVGDEFRRIYGSPDMAIASRTRRPGRRSLAPGGSKGKYK